MPGAGDCVEGQAIGEVDLMLYKISIVRLEPNPEFEAQLEAYREKERYLTYQTNGYPAAEREVKKLETVLTEDEFNAVRKACLERM